MGLQSLIRNWSSLRSLTRRLSSINTSSRLLFVEPVKSRMLLRIVGSEAHEYLQGLITNDMNHLNELSECLYAMFLNGKGRILYDTIIYKTSEPKIYIIEGDSSALDSLKKHLLMYKVRRKISVESADDLSLWVICKDIKMNNVSKEMDMLSISCQLKTTLDNCLVICDPRIPYLGIRVLAPKGMNLLSALQTLPGYQLAPKHFYKLLRYKLGVGEGVAELPPGQSFPLEANCDYLNGVSFNKGCYIGQELTARTYHTGVVRKRLMPITFIENIDSSEIDIPISLETVKERPVGKLRGVEGMAGIALLRTEEALKSGKLIIRDKSCTTSRPFWWPDDIQQK